MGRRDPGCTLVFQNAIANYKQSVVCADRRSMQIFIQTEVATNLEDSLRIRASVGFMRAVLVHICRFMVCIWRFLHDLDMSRWAMISHDKDGRPKHSTKHLVGDSACMLGELRADSRLVHWKR